MNNLTRTCTYLCLTLIDSVSQSCTHCARLFGSSTRSRSLYFPKSSYSPSSRSTHSNICVTTVFTSDLLLSLWGTVKLCNSFKLHVILPIVRPLRSGSKMMSKGMELPKTIALLGMLMQYSTLFGQRFSTNF